MKDGTFDPAYRIRNTVRVERRASATNMVSVTTTDGILGLTRDAPTVEEVEQPPRVTPPVTADYEDGVVTLRDDEGHIRGVCSVDVYTSIRHGEPLASTDAKDFT